MSKPKLTDADFERAARKLKCSVPAIKAVAEVESRGEGFYPSGFPVILFERHKFYKYASPTVKKNWRQYSDICNPDPGGYGAPGQHQRNKFNKAFNLDPIAAMLSCSWGKFQIMGFNHEVCGYKTVGEFVDAMKESEGKQLDAFVSFVIGNGLGKHLRSLAWDKFASGYNGANYKINKYDTKMAKAYAKYSKDSAAPNAKTEATASPTGLTSASTTALPTPEPPNDTPIAGQVAEQIINTGDNANLPPPEDKVVSAPPKDGATSSATKMTIAGIVIPGFLVGIIKAIQDAIANGFISAAEVGTTVLTFIRENQKYVFILIGLLILLLIVKKVVKVITFWIEMISKAIPTWNNVTVVATPVVVERKRWWEFWK